MRLLDTFGIPALTVAAVSLTAGTSWAQCPADDTFEDNDDCATAAVIPSGLTSGLVVQGAANINGLDNDYWIIQGVPNGQILTVDVLFIDANGDIDTTLYDDAACSVFLDGSTSVSDNEQVSTTNASGAAKDYYLNVRAFGSTFDCNDYSLQITIAPDPCATPTDDSLEENDDCASAVALASGATTGLFVSETDYDFYTISVPANDQLTVDVSYLGGSGDVDLRLYDDLACTNQVDSVFPAGGSGQVTWTNATGAVATVVLSAEVAAGQGCNNYDLNVATAPDPCLAGGDDTFEDNDDCGTASVLPSGTTSGLRVFGAASAVDDDYYVIQGVPTGMILTVDALFIDANGDIDITLFDDPACSNQVDGSFSVSDNEQVSVANGSGVAQDYYLRVYAFGSTHDCNDYDLSVSIAPDPCAVAADDGFEENDDCASAVALASGAHAGLFASETDPDFYTVGVPAGEILTVDVTYVSGINGDVDLRLYDDLACTNQVDSVFPGAGTGQVSWSNTTGAAATVVLTAEVAAGEGCNNYDLNVATAPDPCLNPASDDGFEDNDDCANAVGMADGTFTDLFVVKGDDDFYEVSVADGDTLSVDIFFVDDTADVDIYLYDDQIACGDLTSYLVRGFTASDDESISWTNTSGSVATYYIQVVVYAFSSGDCNDYDMTIMGSGGSLATPFCFGDGTADVGSGQVGCPCGNNSALGAGEGCNSSLGFGAILTSSGTSIVANDDLSFTLTQGRPNQPGLLVQGSTLIAVPFKDGVLCMGNPTERVEVVFLDANGEGTTASSIVTEGNVSAGDTRYYQMWFRDPGGISPCGSGSNFSQGLMLTWM